MLRRRTDEGGFTLIETLAALLVFGLVTVGIIPLMLASIRGSHYSRTATVAKNLVVEAIERARGLPFHRDVSGTDGNPKRVDLLDLYFPRGWGAVDTDGTYSANVFTITCDSTSVLSPACPKSTASDGTIQSAIPPGYSLTFTAEFVTAVAGAGGEETYTTATVDNNYYWQGSASAPGPVCPNLPCESTPESELLRLTVTANWTVGGVGPRSFSTTSILGNRRFSGLLIRGSATIDNLIEMSTGLSSAEGESTLVVTAGTSESDMEVRAVTRARYSGAAARLQLRDITPTLVPVVDLEGASFAGEAPTDFDLASADSENAIRAFRVDLGTVAGADDSTITNATGSVAIDLPTSGGTINLNGGDGDSPEGLLWLTTQVDPLNNPLRVFDLTRVAWLEELGGTELTSSVASSSTATTTTPRAIENVASGSFGNLRLIPTDFIPINETAPDGPKGGPVVEVRDFTAEVSCAATTDAATSAADAASVSWSATLRIWTEANGPTPGGYTTVLNLTQSNATTLLGGLGNPMVYEDTTSVEGLLNRPEGSEGDIHLFPETHVHAVVGDTDGDGDEDEDDPDTVTHNHLGYLEPSTLRANAGSTDADADRRVVTASLDGALSLETSSLNPAIPQSGVLVDLGRMHCESVDLRP